MPSPGLFLSSFSFFFSFSFKQVFKNGFIPTILTMKGKCPGIVFPNSVLIALGTKIKLACFELTSLTWLTSA